MLLYKPQETLELIPTDAVLDLRGNDKLQTVPLNIKYMNMCKMSLPEKSIRCNCGNTWMQTWQKTRGCAGSVGTCQLPSSRMVPINSSWPEELGCNEDVMDLTPLLVTQALLIVLLAALSYVVHHFRYEILILYLNTRSSAVGPVYEFDAFLSFDEEDVILRKWVTGDLVPKLEDMGYRIYLPLRDLVGGSVRDEETITQLRKSRVFLLLLSESYLQQEGHAWTDNEWKYGWSMFREIRDKDIVLVNYDHIPSGEVDHLQIRAFIRVGRPIDFSNREGSIMEEIGERLGARTPVEMAVRQADQNGKPVFLRKETTYC